MAMNKWWQDTREGMKINPLCRYFLLTSIVLVFSLTIMGVGFVLLWQAIPHFLAAFAPFYAWPRRALGQLGLASSNFERFVSQEGVNKRIWIWAFSVTQLIAGVFFLSGAMFLILKANFSLLTLALTYIR
jgi:hypothetical protein